MSNNVTVSHVSTALKAAWTTTSSSDIQTIAYNKINDSYANWQMSDFLRKHLQEIDTLSFVDALDVISKFDSLTRAYIINIQVKFVDLPELTRVSFRISQEDLSRPNINEILQIEIARIKDDLTAIYHKHWTSINEMQEARRREQVQKMILTLREVEKVPEKAGGLVREQCAYPNCSEEAAYRGNGKIVLCKQHGQMWWQ